MSESSGVSNIFYAFDDIDGSMAKEFDEFIEANNVYRERSLYIYINSYGGCLSDLLAIVHSMKKCHHPIITIATGAAMSCGLMWLICGDYRIAYTDADLMSHQFSGGTGFNKYHELVNMADNFERTHAVIKNLYSFHAKKKLPKHLLEKRLLGKTDCYVTPEELLKYGLIDEIANPYGERSGIQTQ